MNGGQKLNERKELRTKIFLGVTIVISELTIIFLTQSLDSLGILLTILAIVALNLSFVVFWDRQRKTQNQLLFANKTKSLEHERILTLINSLPEAILSVNSRGEVELFNSAALDLLNTNENIIGRRISKLLTLAKTNTKKFDFQEVFRSDKPYFSSNNLTLSSSDEKPRIELEIITVHGAFSNDKKRNPRKFVVILRDITKQKTLDEERDEFISVVSHELRTPVAITEGALSNLKIMIEKKMPFEKLQKNAETTYKQVIFLSTMINDLSTLSRAERGIGDQIEEICPKELGENLYNKYQKSASEKGLELNLNIENGIKKVKTSQLYLEELLQNFITNALKYTREGSVEISFKNSKNGVIFAIKDTGIGISKSDHKKVFEKFYRSEDWRTRETGGTGLGLYVARKLANKIGTKIELESKLNHGSVFSFELPAVKK